MLCQEVCLWYQGMQVQGRSQVLRRQESLHQVQATLLRQEVCLWNQGMQSQGWIQVLWKTLHRMQASLLRQEVRLWHQSLQGWSQGQVLLNPEVSRTPSPYNVSPSLQ